MEDWSVTHSATDQKLYRYSVNGVLISTSQPKSNESLELNRLRQQDVCFGEEAKPIKDTSC